MKSETKYKMWFIALYLVAIVGLVLLMASCEKEPDSYQPTGYRPVYAHEGCYAGILEVYCDSFPYHKKRTDQVEIVALDGERMMTHSSLGYGYGNNGYNYYRIDITYLDETDCDLDLVITLQITGRIVGDSLIENGSLVAKRYDKPYSGKYKFRGKKQ